MSRAVHSGAAAVLLLLAGAAGAAPALAATALAPETWGARVTVGGGFAWESRFEAAAGGGAVLVRVGVHLVPAGGVTRAQLDAVVPAWRAAAERLWGGRFAIETAAGERYPILVTVDFQGPQFHHDVVVRPGRGRTDQLGWHLGDPPQVVAHEIGHMLGAHDDYPGGANGPAGALADRGSLMGAAPGLTAAPRERHLERVREWFEARSGVAAAVVPLASRPVALQGVDPAPQRAAGEGAP